MVLISGKVNVGTGLFLALTSASKSCSLQLWLLETLSPFEVTNEGNCCAGGIKVEGRKVFLKVFLIKFIHVDETLTCYSIPQRHLH